MLALLVLIIIDSNVWITFVFILQFCETQVRSYAMEVIGRQLKCSETILVCPFELTIF